MATNKLILNIPDIMTDCVLRVEDMSVYEPLMPYTCPTLQVTVPGFTNCITFDSSTVPAVAKGFVFNLTACDLELQTTDCGTEYNTLPDGVYILNYSLSPNDRLYVEYNHLRMTALKKKLREEWCKLKLGACEPTAEIQAKFNELVKITGYLDAAKASAEFCLDIEKAMDLYNYAKKLLDNFTCKLY